MTEHGKLIGKGDFNHDLIRMSYTFKHDLHIQGRNYYFRALCKLYLIQLDPSGLSSLLESVPSGPPAVAVAAGQLRRCAHVSSIGKCMDVLD